MERILLCTRQIIKNEMPKNSNGDPSIFGMPIKSWFHGDRAVIALNNLPAVAFDAEDIGNEFITFHGYQKNWSFSILSYVQLDQNDNTTTLLNYLTNTIIRILQKHTKMWIFEPCFICGQDFLNPSHLIEHSDELSALANTVKTEFTQRWNVTHQTQAGGATPTAPTMNDADAYAAAYYRLYESGTISSPTTVTYRRGGVSKTISNQLILDSYKEMLVQPVRFLSWVMVDSVNYGIVPKTGNQYLRGSQIKVSAKEIDPIHIFGPYNV